MGINLPFMQKQVIALILKDLQVDWRNKYPVAGLLLYIVVLVIIAYLSFANFILPEVWNALFWIILLFTSVNAIAKSFIQEDDRSMYYFFTAKPIAIILGKLIYHFIYQLALVLVAYFFFSLFLGAATGNLGLFTLNLLVGSVGLSSAFTLISALASKTNNQSIMMAILGFPVIIPVLILAITNSKMIILGGGWADISINFITLISVNMIIIALTFILFPFTWKS
ncbi:MAG: heme exporter protein B [Cyclobacteriaceae bacterium]|jgi:heme exporter protein B